MKIKRNEKGKNGSKKDIKYDFEALNKKLVGRSLFLDYFHSDLNHSFIAL
jgi:hypothetical protein